MQATIGPVLPVRRRLFGDGDRFHVVIRALGSGLAAATLLAAAGCSREPTAADVAVAEDPPASTRSATLKPTHLAYVTNEDSNDLTVIAIPGRKVVATIPVGKRPRGVRVSPDGSLVYVALSGSPKCPPTMPDEECEALVTDKSADGIAEVDATSRRVTRVLPGGSDPETFDIDWQARRLFVSNEDSNEATIVDLDSAEVLHTVAVGREPEGVRLAPDGSRFYVTAETDSSVTIVDARSGEVRGEIKVGTRPRDVLFSPDGRRAFTSDELAAQVSVIDVETEQVEAKNISSFLIPFSMRDSIQVTANPRQLGAMAGYIAPKEELDALTGAVCRAPSGPSVMNRMSIRAVCSFRAISARIS